ncbi:MAG: NupC/NupG family nucleoside CNT transporter [Candidatus Marinimicrobia bacterium]|jgi:CNT family concentrative nucleoside transporter|nr:NupC/NupG family nucleoside CNT transporter [Candidatus Neomarinimicrobiota bacterium]MBT3575276.1 NupC/NupG family nucleoside CNT transporter [Candidatus Neomarinimicrobiota bacterium]MBT3680375.1 NupC/NupG family nucleoside CNT transporter [Candidatus Neomarinimicrobiota bacterium]MBT3951804.1 NupC/NupG family nucleoside CNT transporter [Candidatus Neomarinimicrobiota bacterium]MBT4252762.1 NupC/NupG family nucleoside CNT transporter [Candidatus Neomarinimicrobiota bacterium]
MQRLIGFLGIAAILGIAFLMSNNRKAINYRVVYWGLGLQLAFAIFILATPIGKPVFMFLDRAINKLLSFSDAGAEFLFGALAISPGQENSLGFFFAFQILPTIIFFSAFMAILYHFGIMQLVVKYIAKGMQRTMGTSGSETLSASGNIFVGQTEAPLLIRPFIKTMTKSEYMAVMTGGFATMAGGVLAIYAKWLTDIPNIAGHLMAASVMSAPAALVLAKIIYPEVEDSPTAGDNMVEMEKPQGNVMESIANGTSDGMRLAANVGAMLIAIVALVAAANFALGMVGLSIQQILGWVFSPLAFLMGVPWSDVTLVGQLMGEKIVLTELIAYSHLQDVMGQIDEKSMIISSYALCGFANFSSIGIQIGGIGALAPERRGDLSKVAFKAMIGGALASWLTATVAGIMI